MNNLQPFEKHLADQLQQVPVPNREEGWIEMRKLLDRELPEGGTAWSGNRKWWWMGLTVAIIITGLWMREEFQHKQQVAHNEQSPVSKQEIAKSDISSPGTSDKKNSNNQSTVEKNPTRSNLNTTIDAAKVENNKTAVIFNSENKTNKRFEKSNDRYSIKNGEHVVCSNSVQQDYLYATSNKNGSPNNNMGKKASMKTKMGVAIGAATIAGGNSLSSNAVPLSSSKDGSLNSDVVGSNNQGANNGEEETPTIKSVSSISTSAVFFNDPMAEVSSIPSSFEPLKAQPGKTDRAFTKAMRKNSIKADNRKLSAREMRGDVKEKDPDLTFAAGLALPQSFAIAGQQTSSYGVNANSSRASDYLPVPYFQYHMNSRLFLQTELQFQSPQYTDRLLVYQGQQQVASSMLEKNIFIEKLYYFHIPFNVYFSPAKNFYVGSGIQFSSLLSGVATYQNNVYNGSTLQNSYSRVEGFKDDSLASKLSSSEWRYQLDANYYLKRFTFGARYNQALSQFVNIQPSPTLPYTVGRNQSFFIYLRYNIWEERKK
jgi:hypothetical protein